MQEMKLNEQWTMIDGEKRHACDIPCSVYDTLIRAGEIPDPYVGENEWISTGVCDRDFTFEKRFEISEELLESDRLYLRMAGVDTLAEIYVNDTLVGKTNNMHRTWEFDLREAARAGENLLRVRIQSPNRYVTEKQAARPLWGVEGTLPGYQHLRKPHCMFGWDWGPILPDMGIWREVSVAGYTEGRILDVYYIQRHEAGKVTLGCRANLEIWGEGVSATLTVIGPEGQTYSAEIKDGQAEIEIRDPQLWWVRGLGAQPLYTCRVELKKDGKALDAHQRRIGLRTLTISQAEDEWGREFCFINNRVKVFAMGANYIPEDQIYPRATAERTRKLLSDCKDANYNFIRVWGGGNYPSDDFYDYCDENGLIIWQDCMFACAAYVLTPEFEETVRAEIRDNVIRLRNHPALGLWCGNNEIESAWEGWGLPEDPEARRDYLRLFEGIIPEIMAKHDPETFYWPSSPSSGGGIQDASSNRAGDMHYWAVWHNFKPIEAFREFYYRFCSEYGFESLPDMKTIRYFAEEKDLDLTGNVIQAHQKCVQGNEKVMYYLAQMVNYPYDFERLIYCSQLVQADCIRSNVEHMRRARGRCMGSAYWQVNDSNPVISWSSIDYFGRWKGLHYAARRFYAPMLLSCDDTDPLHPALHVTNDTPRAEKLRVVCRLRNRSAAVIREWETEITAEALSSRKVMDIDLTGLVESRQEKRTRYLEYALIRAGETLSAGTTLLVRPKEFEFLPAKMDVQVSETAEEFVLNLSADCFAKSVRLGLKEADCVFSDNWFDIHGEQKVTVKAWKQDLQGVTLAEFQAQLMIENY
ncbi:MAG: glycoside hydrolase family 2 protein [Clostridia bacterium]|nr:glycoside hydrolase family 2 protein [Clostridia bacterium]